MTATMITRMSKTLKAEAVTAASKLNLIDYVVSSDGRTIEDVVDGGFYPVLYFRNGDEVIAVPDFYIGEDSVSFTGSKGGEYTLVNETLHIG